MEALSKSLQRSILVTQPVADRLARPLNACGQHMLRGMAQPITLFSPNPGSDGTVRRRHS